jgi:hypothetical protein
MRWLLASALLLVPGSALAQEEVLPPNPAPATTHTFVEARIGAVGLQPLGTRDGGALRYGPAFELGAGIGFRFLDLGLVGRYGIASGATYSAFGPELALRKSLGDGATFRFGVIPLYAVVWDARGSHGRVGADAIAQLLFTLDNKSRPAWRAGVGLRAGRWAATRSDDPGWSVGVDLLVRSWW